MTDLKNYNFIKDFISQEYGTPKFSNDNFTTWEFPITLYSINEEVRIYDFNLNIQFIDELLKIGEKLNFEIEFFDDAIEGIKCDCCDSSVTIHHEGIEVYSEFSKYFNEEDDVETVFRIIDKYGFEHHFFLGDIRRGADPTDRTLIDKSYRNRKNYQRSKKKNRAIGSR